MQADPRNLLQSALEPVMEYPDHYLIFNNMNAILIDVFTNAELVS